MMLDFIHMRREEIAGLCRRYHVQRLSIFGSATRADFDIVASDIDVIVDFDLAAIGNYSRNKWALHDELTRFFGRKVDLLTWESVRNPYLFDEIKRSTEELYAA